MRYSIISPDSDIVLKSVLSRGDTPLKAINEAIDFVKEKGLYGVELHYCGFKMFIDSEVDITQLVSEFAIWQSLQNPR